MGRNSKKNKPEDSMLGTTNLTITGEEEEESIAEIEPKKPLEWWQISDEDGYDANLEVARVYNEFIKKQEEKKAASKSTPDNAKQIIFRQRSVSIIEDQEEEQQDQNLDKKRLKLQGQSLQKTPDNTISIAKVTNTSISTIMNSLKIKINMAL